MLLIAIIVLTLAGVFRPSWRVFVLFLVFVVSLQAAVLAYSAGLFEAGVDYASPAAAAIFREMAKVLVINTLIVATVGAIVVLISKHFRDRDRRELEMLAALTKPRSE